MYSFFALLPGVGRGTRVRQSGYVRLGRQTGGRM